MRPVLLALAISLTAAAPAEAVKITTDVSPAAGVRLDDISQIDGRLTYRGAPLADRLLTLEVIGHPYRRGWKKAATTRTDADGRYRFLHGFRRNHRVRVKLAQSPATGQTPALPETFSRYRNAYVLPAFKLSYVQKKGDRILITQSYRVPSSIRLTAPTRFYLGPCEPDNAGACTAKSAPFVRETKTRRVSRTLFRARALVKIPRSYQGRFSYVSCFDYSKTSGLGDPGQSCPRSQVRLTRPAAATASERSAVRDNR